MGAVDRLKAVAFDLTDEDLSLIVALCAVHGDNIVALAKGRLDWSPKSNWVEKAGGLPKYIEDIAVALIRDQGMTRERAIATAVSRVKKWAAGGDGVSAEVQAKAAKALAEWEKMKASTHTKDAAK